MKNIPLKKAESKKRPEGPDNKIFSGLNFQTDAKPPVSDNDKLDEIRSTLIKHMFKRKIMLIETLVFILIGIFAGWEISCMFITIALMSYIFIFYYPQIKEKNSYSSLNHDLPYALRHMGIELKSGKGLHDTLITIKNADYGMLSKEFNRVLEEVKYGKSTEESLLGMSHRVKSEGLTRAIQQIIGTLRVGGNLANSLDIIAKDISFETHIKLKEYSQKLNSFILIYTFIAILAPVIILIMAMAGSTVMGDMISGSLLMLIYCLFFPLVVMFMGILIKKLEPNV
jgi:flagellar protein FlaJ